MITPNIFDRNAHVWACEKSTSFTGANATLVCKDQVILASYSKISSWQETFWFNDSKTHSLLSFYSSMCCFGNFMAFWNPPTLLAFEWGIQKVRFRRSWTSLKPTTQQFFFNMFFLVSQLKTCLWFAKSFGSFLMFLATCCNPPVMPKIIGWSFSVLPFGKRCVTTRQGETRRDGREKEHQMAFDQLPALCR